MKYLIVLFALAALAYAEMDADFKEKVIKKIQEAGTQCAETENANGDDIGELMAKKAPSRKEGKCLLACFNQKFGIQDKDGKISLEGALKSIEPFKAADADVYGKMKAVFEKCIPEVGDLGDRCENAVKLAGCTKRECEAAGITEELLM